jgi:alpha-D-xyloside xylohydrolase
MKKIKLLLICLLTTFNLFAQQFQKTERGVKTNLLSMNVEILFYSPDIVRVIKSPEGVAINKQSLSVIKEAEKVDVRVSDDGQSVKISSSLLQVKLNLQTGKVTYLDTEENILFTEKDYGAQFTPTMDANRPSFFVRQAFWLDKNEAIYGLGQQQNGKLMQRGQRVILKNDNMKICIPYIYSTKGYSVFWDNYSATTFTDNLQETSFESLGNCCDYYFMYGKTGSRTLAKMRELTGQSPMLPLWAYGYWQSRERYKTQYELTEVVEKYRALKIPLDGIVQDWQYWGKDSLWNSMSFDSSTFPDPKAMADKVHSMNAHLMVVAWPGFGPLTKQYAEFKEKKMLINFDTWPPKAGAKPYDLYNPEARDIYWNYLNKGVFNIGTDAWWLDSSEPDHINVKDKDFDQPTYLGSYRSVVNAFPLMHTKGVYEHQRGTTSEKRVCILTRSAFAGQQRYAANSWSGDVRSSWETLGKQIPAALNFSLCGIPYWNADIGGFFASAYKKDGGAKNPEFQELYTRWAQFALFTPMMRSHGTDIPREIYQFGEKGSWAFDAIEKSIRMRYRLLPYLYSTAWDVTSQAATFMNAFPIEFASDDKVLDLPDEYIFGQAFLVAPVVKPMYTSKNNGMVQVDFSKIKTRQIYLPKGANWFDFWTGQKLQGGQEIAKEAPIDVIPLFVKAGAIIPWGPDVQFATEKKWDNLEIRVYPGADASFTLYEDENDNYNYEKGIFSTIDFRWDDSKQMLIVGARKGEFPGMLKSRLFRIVVVSEKNGTGVAESATPAKVVKYSGKQIEVKL